MCCLISIKDMLSISKLNEGKWDKIITVTKKILILLSKSQQLHCQQLKKNKPKTTTTQTSQEIKDLQENVDL